jgi:hypothetical protein
VFGGKSTEASILKAAGAVKGVGDTENSTLSRERGRERGRDREQKERKRERENDVDDVDND